MNTFRVYDSAVDPFDGKGYPVAWQEIKHLVRAEAGDRCLRCRHPYEKGDGEWSACDERCAHLGPVRSRELHRGDGAWTEYDLDVIGRPAGEGILDEGPNGPIDRWEVEARWRVLTVHHLDGVKSNCRWWNLVPLCQRCHLLIQRKVVMHRPWPWPHTDWFQPYAAAFYAVKYLDADLSREETMQRLVELLALGQEREADERMPV